MGEKSDAPAILTAIGVALLVGAGWVTLVSVQAMPRPVAPIALLIVAAACFALGAAAKAVDRR